MNIEREHDDDKTTIHSMADKVRIAKEIIQSDSERRKKSRDRGYTERKSEKNRQIHHTRLDDLSDHTSYYNAKPKFVEIEP